MRQVLGIAILLVAPTLHAQNLVGFFSLSAPGGLQLGTIDPSNGNISMIGSAQPAAPFSAKTAIDTTGNRFFFIEATGSGVIRTLDMSDGLQLNSHALTGLGTASLFSMRYDEGESTLFGFFSDAGARRIGTINPTTGAVTLLPLLSAGASISSTALIALNEGGNRLYFEGTPIAVSNIYSIDTGTGADTSVELSPDPNVSAWAYDGGESTLFAIYSSGTDRQLGSINPASGVVTDIGSSIAVGSSTGIAALDENGDRYFFIGTPPMGSLSVYTVNTNTGAATSQTLTFPVGISNLHNLEYDLNAVPVELMSLSVE